VDNGSERNKTEEKDKPILTTQNLILKVLNEDALLQHGTT